MISRVNITIPFEIIFERNEKKDGTYEHECSHEKYFPTFKRIHRSFIHDYDTRHANLI